MTSDHVKELTEEVEKLAKENVGEVRRKAEREAGTRPETAAGEREQVYVHVHVHVCERRR